MKINQMKIKLEENFFGSTQFSAEISVDFSSVGKFKKLAKTEEETKRVIPIAKESFG